MKASVVANVIAAASCTSTLKSTYWPSEEMFPYWDVGGDAKQLMLVTSSRPVDHCSRILAGDCFGGTSR